MGKGFDIFMENPYWKKYYENAPSETLKEYIRIEFDNNPFATDEVADNYEEEMAKIESRFTNEDWQYLIDNTTNGMAKIEYRKRLVLQSEPQKNTELDKQDKLKDKYEDNDN